MKTYTYTYIVDIDDKWKIVKSRLVPSGFSLNQNALISDCKELLENAELHDLVGSSDIRNMLNRIDKFLND